MIPRLAIPRPLLLAAACLSLLACTHPSQSGTRLDIGQVEPTADQGDAEPPNVAPDTGSETRAQDSAGPQDGAGAEDGTSAEDGTGAQDAHPPETTPESGCQGPADCPALSACTVPRCQGGACVYALRHGACDDHNPCTQDDTCQAGTCQGAAYLCAACQLCDGAGGCVLAPETCAIAGTCYPEGQPHPTQGCLACVPQQNPYGWSPALAGLPCNDGDPCTLGDRCHAGTCAGPIPRVCDDHNACTQDHCVAGGGCAFDPVPDQSPCNDNNACTVAEVCLSGVCAGTPLDCDDHNPCTDTACDTTSGCQTTLVDGPCNDHNACTEGDTCQNGVCIPGEAIECDDGVVCTIDSCDPEAGCVFNNVCCGDVGIPCPSWFSCTPQGTCESPTDVYVPEGPFWQGGGNNSGPESPAHEVIIAGFAIDRTEVTVGAYKACVNAGACTLPAPLPPAHGPSTYTDPDSSDEHPVNAVTWQQAVTYCAYVGKRLPTESEWEKAARGGCDGTEEECVPLQPLYPWGTTPITCEYAVFDSTKYTDSGCGVGGPWPVGSKPAGMSVYGALDMAGNVREWVADWYAADYYCKGPQAECFSYEYAECVPGCAQQAPFQAPWWVPKGPDSGLYRVTRGGSAMGTLSLTVHGRGWALPTFQLSGLGFRCARDKP